jgi:CRP-like cAMP-binding protein
MGLLDESPRTATVTALKDTETIELDGAALARAIVEYPEVTTALIRVLSQRLRCTDELVEYLSAKGRDAEQ